MKKQPVRGMRDMLPRDVALRQYLLKIIERRAGEAGYEKIETPVMEHLENLTSKDGGENETLIFKVMKRGQELERAKASGDELSDSALRYDLTVPLSRYYAANVAELSAPFKSLQIGSVWRADAPQKGRYRQFVQCDMDILGDASILAEIDTIDTVMGILGEVCEKAGITGLTIHLNDRRILQAAAKYAGFNEEEYGSVLIALDKNDKIGFEGVRKELEKRGFEAGAIDRFMQLFDGFEEGIDMREFCAEFDSEILGKRTLDDLESIMAAIPEGKKAVFDPSLVRGMGYYTGPIFECTADGLDSSIAGGGRY
ncbi:ATP phosphoribosyltransferase regulatory subunit, partial [Candidatus Saccharibacteria bacterium]|nr:ATP phosphoribosyltransferase regulatory subunit [Candidatus Saccharibacteria bacterium]